MEQMWAMDAGMQKRFLKGKANIKLSINDIFYSQKWPLILIKARALDDLMEKIPGYEIALKGTLTVALDITITEDLQKEGDAREFVNKIQTIRKDSGFLLTDRISVLILQNEALYKSLTEYKTYICAEILADTIEFVDFLNEGTQIEVNETNLTVMVNKI